MVITQMKLLKLSLEIKNKNKIFYDEITSRPKKISNFSDLLKIEHDNLID